MSNNYLVVEMPILPENGQDPQTVTDHMGNPSPLTLGLQTVRIGTKDTEAKLEVESNQSPLIGLKQGGKEWWLKVSAGAWVLTEGGTDDRVSVEPGGELRARQGLTVEGAGGGAWGIQEAAGGLSLRENGNDERVSIDPGGRLTARQGLVVEGTQGEDGRLELRDRGNGYASLHLAPGGSTNTTAFDVSQQDGALKVWNHGPSSWTNRVTLKDDRLEVHGTLKADRLVCPTVDTNSENGQEVGEVVWDAQAKGLRVWDGGSWQNA